MSNETEKPETQPDEPQKQKLEQDETLSKPGDESSKPEGQVADDQLPQEGDPKATEPEERAEDPQPNPRMPPTPMHHARKAVPWVIGFLVMFGLYQCGYSNGQFEERMKNISRVPEKEVVLQIDPKAIAEAVRAERAKQRVLTEVQFSMLVNGLEKNLDQLKSELEYRQLWERFESGEDAGRCTKGAYSGQVSCTSGLRADLNEYLARLEARNICASGEWTAVQSDAPAESAASEASAPQSASPQVEYKDGLVFKFCQRPEFESQDSAE